MAGKLSKTAQSAPVRRGTVLATKMATPDTTTHQGGKGFSKDAKTELFTLAVSNFVGENTFYETAQTRDSRFVTLLDQVSREDPAWTANLLYWLRSEGNMRSASIVGAVEYGRSVNAADNTSRDPNAPTPRTVLTSVLQRADEPAEALGYWLGKYGRPIPKWLKRALADAAARLYNPYAVFKYDTGSAPIRFGDVVQLSQAKHELAVGKWLLDRRYGREEGDYGIEMLHARKRLETLDIEGRRNLLKLPGADQVLRDAGMTWESVSGWIQGPMDAKVWESIIPSMGYMALLRNLRNFDESNVSDAVAQQVIARITDPEQVAKSRQLPFRFLSAYLAVPSDRWKHALAVALDLSLVNVPELGGKSLILIDTSGSMGQVMSGRSTVEYWKQAALFGLALAKSQKQQADIVGFDTSVYPFALKAGENTLRTLERFGRTVRGGGTHTEAAIRSQFRNGVHNRVVVLTDAQAAADWGLGYYHYGASRGRVGTPGVFSSVPESVPCYTYDVSGYSSAHDVAGTPTRRLFAGLTDSAFKMMKVLEARHGRGLWPWEITD